LEPTKGSEIRKRRPCVVVSTDALAALPLRVVVPLSGWRPHHERHRTRVPIPVDATNGLSKDSGADAVQVRRVALERFRSRLGTMHADQLADVASAVAMVVEAV
jgi:mRNA interferase MazF